MQSSPSPLHENLIAGFGELQDEDQTRIANALEQLVSIMEIDQVDAAPILETTQELDRPLANQAALWRTQSSICPQLLALNISV